MGTVKKAISRWEKRAIGFSLDKVDDEVLDMVNKAMKLNNPALAGRKKRRMGLGSSWPVKEDT